MNRCGRIFIWRQHVRRAAAGGAPADAARVGAPRQEPAVGRHVVGRQRAAVAEEPLGRLFQVSRFRSLFLFLFGFFPSPPLVSFFFLFSFLISLTEGWGSRYRVAFSH